MPWKKSTWKNKKNVGLLHDYEYIGNVKNEDSKDKKEIAIAVERSKHVNYKDSREEKYCN